MTRSKKNRQRRAVFALAAALTIAALIGRAWAAGPTFADAQHAYADGHYAEAATVLEAIAHERGWSAPLLYDLGNAYEKQGRFGEAIASYERARLLAPRDRDLAANLALARAAVDVPAASQSWYRAAARSLSGAEWSWMGAASLFLVCLSLGALALRPRLRRVSLALSAVALLTGLTSIAALVIASPSAGDAIVVSRGSAPIRLSPFDSAAVEAIVREGEHVTVTERHGGFVRVRDDRGQAGWADAAAVERITAPRS